MNDAQILRFYVTLIVSLLAFAGIVLLLLDKVFHKNVRSIWNIYRGWLFIIPSFLALVWLGRIAFIVGILAISVRTFYEFSRATALNASNTWITRVVYASIVFIALLALIRVPDSRYLGWYGLFAVLPAYVIALILLVPIWQNRYQGQLQAVALGTMGFLYFGWMLGHLSFMANSPRFLPYVLYLVFATQIGDISAYTSGKLFGKRKLRSNISPNKTVAGSLGQLAVALLLPWVFRPLLPGLEPLHLWLTGLILGIAGQLGDLSISLIKRDIGIKDMSALIPGHGGLLDRVDSLILTAPLFFHMTRYFGLLFPGS